MNKLTNPIAKDDLEFGLRKKVGQNEILLEVKNLQKHFPIQKGFLRKTTGWIKAVDGVSFDIKAGETLGLVGESGCGKTTAGRCILQLEKPTGGEINFYQDGKKTSVNFHTIHTLKEDMQIIFQDPYSSLDPRMTIERIIAEPLLTHGMKDTVEIHARIVDLLKSVGLSVEQMKRFPHEFSGGQRQRIGIARALALNPKLIICDEPVSALDVSIQAQVINLLEDLQQQLGLTYLFISHDLSVVNYLCDRVAVMYLGQIVELTAVDELFANPCHPYTEALFSAIPVPDPDFQFEQIILEGDVPSPANPPTGCHFHPRCRYVQTICKNEPAILKPLSNNSSHYTSCHLAEKLILKGVNGST
jgi:oligopeptide/dipeptide ABC transporter ATP-binding protein